MQLGARATSVMQSASSDVAIPQSQLRLPTSIYEREPMGRIVIIELILWGLRTRE